jgi:hypothetical protein
MVIEIISSGLAIIASVTTILQNQERQDVERAETRAFLDQIQQRVRELEDETSRTLQTGRNGAGLLSSYNALLEAIRSNAHYASRLEFRPTDHGTWVLVRRKSTTLRDPEGEYGLLRESGRFG